MPGLSSPSFLFAGTGAVAARAAARGPSKPPMSRRLASLTGERPPVMAVAQSWAWDARCGTATLAILTSATHVQVASVYGLAEQILWAPQGTGKQEGVLRRKR